MPDEQPEIEDLDFAGEMHHLAYEAQLKSSPPAPRLDRKELMLALGQMVRPLAIELENIKRATAENAVLLTILGKAAVAPAATPPAAAPPAPVLSPAPPASDAIERISQQLQRLGSVETANQKLFDALHAELKGYKDNFLFDALQRPFIRDLVSIYDDFSAVYAQVSARLEVTGGNAAPAGMTRTVDPAAEDPKAQTETDFLRMLAGNVNNQIHHLLEVFLRMEVVLSQSPPGTLLDKKMHCTVAFKPAARPEEDAQIARSLKPGFTWRDRMIRPEEVVVYRWTGEQPNPATLEEQKNVSSTKPAAPPDNRRPLAEAKSANMDGIRSTMRISIRDPHRRKPQPEALL